ncbi:MAG: phosphoribosyltransferase family protein [Candidatus Dormibacterales bacterium]
MREAAHRGTYRTRIGTQEVELPLVPVPGGAVSLLMTIDRGVLFMERAGRELAVLLEPSRPQVVASAATLGIPVAIEVTRALGLDDYVILQKTPKIHLREALARPLRSVTTDSEQTLLLDRRRIGALAGRRVAVVDDVIATGSSVCAAVELVEAGGGRVVSIGALLTEGGRWRGALGPRASAVVSLGAIPGFREADEGYVEVWD